MIKVQGGTFTMGCDIGLLMSLLLIKLLYQPIILENLK